MVKYRNPQFRNHSKSRVWLYDSVEISSPNQQRGRAGLLAFLASSRGCIYQIFGTLSLVNSLRRLDYHLYYRLAELRAAHDLSEISYLLPPRCHAVEGIRNDCWAVDTMHPYRLVFKINQEPIPKLPDGGIDKTKVVSIIIQEVEDYHGKQK